VASRGPERPTPGRGAYLALPGGWKAQGPEKGGSGTQQRDGEHEDRDPNKANSDYVHRAASNNIIIRILIERFMLATALAPQRR
jgi:hypothetical protein